MKLFELPCFTLPVELRVLAQDESIMGKAYRTALSGFESEDRYVARPTIEDVLFCYQRRSVENANVDGRVR